MDGASEYLDVLRLSIEEIESLLRKAVRTRPSDESPERREETRHVYRGHPVVLVQIEYPGSEIGAYKAVTSNISSHGIGFFHGKFTYPGSNCRVLLPTVESTLICQEGRVVRCELLEGRVHEVGVRFDASIDLTRIILDRVEETAEAGKASSPE